MTRTHSRRNSLLGAAMAVSLGLIGLGSVAQATEPSFGNIDPAAKGSLTVHKHETGSQTPEGTPDGKTNVTGTPVPDVTFTAYRVTNLDLTAQASWNGLDTLTVPENACGADWASPQLTLPGGLAATFDTGTAGTTGADGSTTLADLPVAAYLVCETTSPASVIRKAAPFLVTVPFPNTAAEAANGDGTWLYDVNVYPKNTVVQAPTKDFGLNKAGIRTGDQVDFPVSVKVPSLASTPQEQYFSYFVVSDPLDSALKDGKVKSVTITAGGTTQDVPASQYTTTEGQNPTVSFTAEGLTALKGQPNATVTVTFTATVDQVPATGQILNTGYFNVDTRTVPGEPDQPDDGKKVPTNEVVTGWGDLKVLKADADKADTGLKGAKFKVYASSDPFAATCDASTKTGDPIAVNDVTEFESDASGVVNIEGLFVDSKVGQKYNVGDPKPTTSLDHSARCYVLEEVQAPAGFVLPTGDQALTAVKVNAGQTVGTDITVNNTKQGVPGLPLTGAAGKVLMMLGGSALVLLGAGTALVVRSRRRHG